MKLNSDIMEKIEKSHDTIIEWKPTMERLKAVFEPDGPFDKITKLVTRHDEKIKSNTKRIGFLSGAVGTAIVGIIVGVVVFWITNK